MERNERWGKVIITIDGPAASGKSTIARGLARTLGYYYLCSGLLYRALGYLLVTQRGYTIENVHQLKQSDIDYCFDPKKFLYNYDQEKGEHIFFMSHSYFSTNGVPNGKQRNWGNDITPYLKDKAIDQIASVISTNTLVRHALTQLQHAIASEYNIVADGRDVGSVIFPHAEHKFFITAAIEVRAQRWQQDQKKYGNNFSLQEAIARITDRDERDKNRTVAPLVVPAGAIIIDTSDITVEQVIEIMMHTIENNSKN